MKILFFTDVHIKGKNPESRIDNYLDALIKKLVFVFDYAKTNNYDLILCGGDLFDSANVSDSIKNVLLPIFKLNTIPLYTIIGSHDY